MSRYNYKMFKEKEEKNSDDRVHFETQGIGNCILKDRQNRNEKVKTKIRMSNFFRL